MSSDSQPSFRLYAKGKIKKIIKSNITSSIRERIISNETYRNFTDTAKNRIGFEKIRNITKELIPGVLPRNDNQTIPKGFYDSLFSPETEEDIYLKVAIMCLWIIAMLCIIPTIITIFIPVQKKGMKTTNVNMIFFHIFLCEFIYLIYILLSMINVAQDFKLNSFFCDIAKYGMYATIPITYFALLVLSIERLTKRFNSTITWTKIFTNVCVTQAILIFIWAIFISVITIIIFLKKQLIESITNPIKSIAPSSIDDAISKIISRPYRCSIDGRLSSIFKILFIILFIILMVIIIKSMVVSIFYNFFTPNCCKIKGKKKVYNDRHITILFVIFLLLNLFFSFPFYFISMANSIITPFISKKDTFTIKLKICFILRLSSIILQCLTFCTIESNSWSLLSKLLFHGTCKKYPVLDENSTYTRKPITTKQVHHKKNLRNNIALNGTRTRHDNNDNDNIEDVVTGSSESEDNDDVFPNEHENKPLDAKNAETTEEDETDQDDSDDDETPVIQKTKLSTRKNDTTNNLPSKRDKIEEEKAPLKKGTSKYNHTNGISKQIPNGKIPSQRISSATTNLKTTKSSAEQNSTKHHSIQSSSSSSSDEISNVSENSDDEVKPSTTITKKQTTISSSNEQKRITTVLPNKHRPHRTKHSQSSRPITTRSSNHNHTKRTKRRRKSPRNSNNHTKKLKQDRLSKIHDNFSDEV